MRLELAQYRELAAFAQFGSDLDKSTQAQLSRGQRLTELLRQRQYAPLTVERQIAILYVGTRGFLDDLEVDHIAAFEEKFYDFMDAHHSDLMSTLAEKKSLDDDIEKELTSAINAFKDQFKADLGVA